MKDILKKFLLLEKNEVVKVKLKNEYIFLLGKISSTGGGIQSGQPAYTPTDRITMQVITNIAAYKADRDTLGIQYEKQFNRESVDVVNLSDV